MFGVLWNRRDGLSRLEMYDLPLMGGEVSIHKHASFNVTAGSFSASGCCLLSESQAVLGLN
jgi:hypothetical protein